MSLNYLIVFKPFEFSYFRKPIQIHNQSIESIYEVAISLNAGAVRLRARGIEMVCRGGGFDTVNVTQLWVGIWLDSIFQGI